MHQLVLKVFNGVLRTCRPINDNWRTQSSKWPLLTWSKLRDTLFLSHEHGGIGYPYYIIFPIWLCTQTLKFSNAFWFFREYLQFHSNIKLTSIMSTAILYNVQYVVYIHIYILLHHLTCYPSEWVSFFL